MKSVKKATSRIAALLLSGMLAIRSVPVATFGTEVDVESGQSTDVVVEDTGENIPEGDVVEQYNDVAPQEEGAVESYTVTLDANGGYFSNEWDDALNETLETAETVTKLIPIGGTVISFPVLEQENAVVTFLGWSLEPNGELVSQGYEEYIPVDNCALYAVWKVEEIPVESEETEEQEVEQAEDVFEDILSEDQQEGGDNNELITEMPDDDVTSQGPEITSGETENAEETRNDGGSQDNISQVIVEEGQEESFSTTAAMGVVESGTCGDNLTWTLDEEGKLVISGTGEMYNFKYNNLPWDSNSVKAVIIENGVTSVGDRAFEDCTSLTSVTIPSSVTKIGQEAFYCCFSLTGVTIPNSVTSIESCAFYGSNLTSVAIPNSVSSIGDSAFFECDSLTSVTIGNSVTRIGQSAFRDCNSLTSVTIGNNVTVIGMNAFSDCGGLTSVKIPDSVRTIGSCAFKNCGGLTSVEIPNSVTDIGYALFQKSALTSIYFKGNAPSIDSFAFIDVTATAYYPANDPTWTEEVRQNYGGNITWVEWDPDIISLMPKNNEINTDHGIIPQVIFSKAMRLSGKGYISLYENNDIVETIEAVEGKHAVVYVDSLDEKNITSTLTLTFQKRFLPGKHYSISIDSNSLEYLEWSNDVSDFIGTGTFFEGINKTEWGFSTTSLDYMHFTNQAIKIPDYMYDFLFKPIKAWWYKRKSTGEKGTCFGWAYAVGAKKQNYYGVNGFGDALAQLVPKTENRYIHHTLLEYIQLAQLYQITNHHFKWWSDKPYKGDCVAALKGRSRKPDTWLPLERVNRSLS